MSNEVKKSKKSQKQSEIEVTFLNTALSKEGNLLEDLTDGKSILEYTLHADYINIMLEDNSIDKNGNRYDAKTGKLLGVKGKNVITEKMRKEWEAKDIDRD